MERCPDSRGIYPHFPSTTLRATKRAAIRTIESTKESIEGSDRDRFVPKTPVNSMERTCPGKQSLDTFSSTGPFILTVGSTLEGIWTTRRGRDFCFLTG